MEMPDAQFATAFLVNLIRQWYLIPFLRKYTKIYQRFIDVQNVQKFIGMALMCRILTYL
jgi:hypothetical protein